MAASAKFEERLPRVHRVRRRLTDGRVSIHWYHRPTRTRLPSPDNPAFQPAYHAAEEQWAAQQLAANPSETPQAIEAENHSPPVAQPIPAGTAEPTKVVTQEFAPRLKDGLCTPAELASKMRRRRAAVTQAEIARIIRAAKQAGAAHVEVRLADSASVIVRLQPDGLLESDEAIIL